MWWENQNCCSIKKQKPLKPCILIAFSRFSAKFVRMFEQLNLFSSSEEKAKPKNFVDKLIGKQQIQTDKKTGSIHFIGEPVEIVRRPYQRSMSILVKPSGKVRITCARLTTKKSIYRFLSENHQWLRKAIDEQRALREAHPPKRYVQGEEFLYMGGQVYLNFSPSTQKKVSFSIIGEQLVALIPKDQWTADYMSQPHPELKQPLIQFYKKSGKKTLALKVNQMSEKMRLYPKKVTYRSQKTRWGSCSSRGNVSLNWRLIAAPMGTLEYVVIHELAHLEYQDHSKCFWSLVKRFCPDHESHSKWLRDHQFEFDFLATQSELHRS